MSLQANPNCQHPSEALCTCKDVGSLASAPCSRFVTTNFAYTIIFLRNGGERTRAIWLAKTCLEISIAEARQWVDSVVLEDEPVMGMFPTIPETSFAPRKVAMAWPPTVTDRMKDQTPPPQ